MYRFLLRPKWIAFHLLCLGRVVLHDLWLGSWQLRRLDERKEFNAEVVARSEQPPVTIDELLAEPGLHARRCGVAARHRHRGLASPADRRLQPVAGRSGRRQRA